MISTPSSQSWGHLEFSETHNSSSKFSLVSPAAGVGPRPIPRQVVETISSGPTGAGEKGGTKQPHSESISLLKMDRGEPSPPLLPPRVGLAANHHP